MPRNSLTSCSHSSLVSRPTVASIFACAILPSTSKGASNKSNSRSLPTVNCSTSLSEVVFFCQSFILVLVSVLCILLKLLFIWFYQIPQVTIQIFKYCYGAPCFCYRRSHKANSFTLECL